MGKFIVVKFTKLFYLQNFHTVWKYIIPLKVLMKTKSKKKNPTCCSLRRKLKSLSMTKGLCLGWRDTGKGISGSVL